MPHLLTTDVDEAAAALRAGGLVAFPTETVYGLGADATQPHAVAAVYAAKGRPADHPLIVHVLDAAALDTWAAGVPDYARALAAAFWPGPLTVVVTAHPDLQLDLGDRGGTIAVRVPDHDFTRALLRRTGPLAVSSANVSGGEAVTTIQQALEQLGAIALAVVDHHVTHAQGLCPRMVPSRRCKPSNTGHADCFLYGAERTAQVLCPPETPTG